MPSVKAVGTRTDLAAGVHGFGAVERVIYGRRFEEVVIEQCAHGSFSRVFVLTTRSLSGSLCVTLKHALGARFAGAFDAFAAHTPIASVLAATDAARRAKPDLIVAIGGGSVIDGAKAVLLALWSGAATQEALDHAQQSVGELPIGAIRMIAIPTTLSGAEFTPMAGVSNAQGRKERLMHPLMVPRVVILDPHAALGTPLPLWLPSGMRSLDHALETISSPHCDVLSEIAALRAIELLCEGLRQTARNTSDVNARLLCQLGAWMAAVGIAGGVPMGVSHAIGHVLGAEYGLPHGVTSCVVMTAALSWNRPAVLDRQKLMEAHLPLPGKTIAQKVNHLLRALELPTRLGDAGIGTGEFRNIAERALTDFCIATNPRPVRSAQDIMEVLQLAA